MPPAALAFCWVSGLWTTALTFSFPGTQCCVTENKHQAIQWAVLYVFLANCWLESSLKILSSHLEEYYPLDSQPSKPQVLILLLRGKISQQGQAPWLYYHASQTYGKISPRLSLWPSEEKKVEPERPSPGSKVTKKKEFLHLKEKNMSKKKKSHITPFMTALVADKTSITLRVTAFKKSYSNEK